MLRVVACVTQEHDLRLVVLAGAVCLLACVTAFNLIARGDGASSVRGRRWWLAGAAAVSGCGVWATHFVAMLAYQPGLPIGYDLPTTTLSVAVAIAIVWLGCLLTGTGVGWAVTGGAIAGAGIAAMHYTGMAALRIQGHTSFDEPMVGLSLVLGVALAAAAFAARERWPNLRGRAGAAGIFALAILALHFTAMSALTLVPDPSLPAAERVASPEWVAVAVAAVTLMILALSFAGSVLDERLATRSAQEAERLRRHVLELEEIKLALETTDANLREALDQADASNRAKSLFLTTMSHELRTPLNAVIGFSELMGMEVHGPLGDARYRDFVANIHQSGAHLLALINDVLDFARLDAAELRLADDEIDVPELLADALRAARAAAINPEIKLCVGVMDADLPCLRADRRRVKQVLLALLSNAVKFTLGPGTVTLAARCRESGMEITVSDTGIGIAPADLAKALEPFCQIDARFTRSYEGSGLGLPLSKQLMELHGGSLAIASEPGRGTVVTLIFPAERLSRSINPEQPEPAYAPPQVRAA